MPLTNSLKRKIRLTNSRKRTKRLDIQPVLSSHVESVVLLSKLHTNKHIEVEFQMDELDLMAVESKTTYE